MPVANDPAVPVGSPLEMAIAELSADDVRTTPLSTPSASVAACTDPGGDDCMIDSAAVWDPAGLRWIVLEVDGSEGGPEAARLIAATPGGDTVLASHAIDRAGLGVLRRATRPFSRLSAPTDRVSEASSTEFSSSTFATLVALDGPLTGWLLGLSTNDDLDHPEHVLRLLRREDGLEVELARRAAELTPCDGDGWTCAAHPDAAECTAAELRAEGRLCVQPQSIGFVGLSDDGSSLLVLGIRIVAGDGGYPAHHWVVSMVLPPP
jgi:hypothetical protein